MGRHKVSDLVREPNGRASRKTEEVKKREAAMRRPNVKARQRHYGLKRSQANDPRAGSVIGRLSISGEVSRVQYEAAMRYLEDFENYKRAIAGPKGAGAVDLGKPGGIATVDPDLEHKRDKQAKEKIQGALLALKAVDGGWQTNVTGSVANVVLEDMDLPYAVGDVRTGLNALVRFYGLQA